MCYDLGFKSAGNLVGFCALLCRSKAQDARRSMFVFDRRPSDWFDSQLRGSSHFIYKMHSNHQFFLKYS